MVDGVDAGCALVQVGVVLHSGSHRSGHYTSLVRHGSHWYTFDDQHVSRLDEAQFEHVCFGGQEEVAGDSTHMPVQPGTRPLGVVVCAARTLSAVGPASLTLSLR